MNDPVSLAQFLAILGVVLGGLVVLAGLWFATRCLAERGRRARTQRMRELARAMGLRYFGHADATSIEHLPPCRLFGRGSHTELRNLCAEDRRPPGVLVFDYEWSDTPPHAPGEVYSEPFEPVDHLVVMLSLARPAPAAPVRVVREDIIGGRPAGEAYRLAVQKHDPVFHDNYWVSGVGRESARKVLTPPVRRALKGWQAPGLMPPPRVEILREWVVVHVESPTADRRLVQRGRALLRYALDVAEALGGPADE
jgi:hypothetical protein